MNAAISSAQAVYNNSNASVSQVNQAATSLTSATTAFSSTVTTNGPGLGTISNIGSITITGLNAYNGYFVQLGLFKSIENLGFTEMPEVRSEDAGEIIGGSVTLMLYDDSGPWVASGSWYAGFQISDGMDWDDGIGFFQAYTTNSMLNFSSSPNRTVSFSNCTPYVFSITVDELIKLVSNGEADFSEFQNQGIAPTMDNLIDGMSQGEVSTYAAFVQFLGFKLWQDKAMTNEYSGNTTLTANKEIFSLVPFWLFMGDDDDRDMGPPIGTITGSVTLTNVPAGVRYMEINLNSEWDSTLNRQWWSSSRITGFSSPTSTVSFQFPVYGPNPDRYYQFISGKICYFRIYVELSNNQSYEVQIPANMAIYNENQNIGSLGTVSLASAAISGSINITYNGTRVPWLDLSVVPTAGGNSLGWADYTPSAATSNWSMLVAANSLPTNAYVYITGLPSRNSNWDARLFDIRLPIGTILASGASGISLNIGNLTANTMRVLNAPAGNCTVYVTDSTISGGNYSSIITNGTYIGSGTGAGGSILLSWKSQPNQNQYYCVLIVSGSQARYLNWSTPFTNGIGVVDWDSMSY